MAGWRACCPFSCLPPRLAAGLNLSAIKKLEGRHRAPVECAPPQACVLAHAPPATQCARLWPLPPLLPSLAALHAVAWEAEGAAGRVFPPAPPCPTGHSCPNCGMKTPLGFVRRPDHQAPPIFPKGGEKTMACSKSCWPLVPARNSTVVAVDAHVWVRVGALLAPHRKTWMQLCRFSRLVCARRGEDSPCPLPPTPGVLLQTPTASYCRCCSCCTISRVAAGRPAGHVVGVQQLVGLVAVGLAQELGIQRLGVKSACVWGEGGIGDLKG